MEGDRQQAWKKSLPFNYLFCLVLAFILLLLTYIYIFYHRHHKGHFQFFFYFKRYHFWKIFMESERTPQAWGYMPALPPNILICF